MNEKNELVVSENSKRNPLIFVEESKKPKALESQVKPVEMTKKKNWTYAGKDTSYEDSFGVVDSMATPATSYKLLVQDNLQKAMETTKKTPSKFLVISYDPDNKETKSEFDNFIYNQQYSLGTYASYENNTEYDKYNYYLATSKDKSWFLKNKITDNPSTIVLDSEGNILAQIKGSLATNNYLFDVYYSSINESLKQIKAISDLNKAINSKAKEKEVLKKMIPLSTKGSGWSIYPPLSAETAFLPPVVEEIVPVTEEISEAAVDTAMAYTDYYNQNEPVYTKINIDKNKLLSTWGRIVKSHEKEAKPDMDFVKVSSSEIQNSGFYSKIFNEERLFDETNFKAIDYLLQHYDEILIEQKKLKLQDSLAVDYDYYDTIDYVLPNAVTLNSYLVTPETSSDYQKRILGIYKKMIEKQLGADITATYFTTLETFARNSNSEEEYVSEYDSFFNRTFKGTNEIEILDDLYGKKVQNGLDYADWTGFKISYASASNQAAWFVVEKSTNPESIKKAIKWSESSLRIEKSSPYYLDTLAQLYYKNGEKQKAISTQEQALKFANDIDENTRQDLETVLEKMKNGTY